MKIAIDIDDTLVLHRTRDVKFTLEFAKANNLDFEFVNGKDMTKGIKINWTSELYEKFWTSSFGKNFYKYASISNQNKQIIKTLQKRGHEIFFITARNPKWQEITQNWLKKNELDVELVFSDKKGQFCLENGIEILIDNDPEICENARELGVRAFHFDSTNKQFHKNTLNDLLKITKTGEDDEKQNFSTVERVL